MKSVTITEAQNMVDKWINSTGVRYFEELTNLGILMEEIGELARVMVRVYGEQSFKNKEDEKKYKSKIEDEISDILFVLICLANQGKIDLNQAFLRNLNKKTKRDRDRHRNNPKLK